MAQDFTDELETKLAREIILLFNRHSLTASQAKSLLEKVKVLVEAEELGLLKQSH